MFEESTDKTSRPLLWTVIFAMVIATFLYILFGCVQVNKSQNFTLNDYGPDKIAETVTNTQDGHWASETDTAIEDALKADAEVSLVP